jgi:UDP-N-acetyl-D-glucosamine dehydrogenase
LEGLRDKGAAVYFCDPYVPSIVIQGQTIKGVELTPHMLQSMDCVAILTDHSVFDYSMVAKSSSLVLDTRNALKDFPRANLSLL